VIARPGGRDPQPRSPRIARRARRRVGACDLEDLLSDPEDPAEYVTPPPDDGDLRRNSSLVAAGILLSRFAGLLREIVTARFLGTGLGAEAFKAAMRIPNLLQNLLGEGVLSASFVPVYSQALAEGRKEEAGRLAGAIAGLLLSVTAVLVLVGVVFAEPVTRLFVPGFIAGTEKFELTVALVRIVTPGIGALVLSAWCLGVLNSHGRFFLSYVAPVLWNVAIIAAVTGTALLLTTDEIALATAMAWGALAGSLLQLGIQLPTVLKSSEGLRLSAKLSTTGVRTVVGRFGHVVAGRGGVQLASYADLIATSLLAAGALVALGYAQVLYLLPVALFGMSAAAAELPTLSTMDQTDRPRVVARLDEGLGRVAFFVVPSAVAFLVAGDQVVTLVYLGGRTGVDAVVQVGAILSALSLGLLASTSSRLLQSALYGTGDTRSPAIYAIIRVVVGLAIGITLMFPLDAIRASAEGFALVGDVRFFEAAPAELRDSADSLLRLGAAGLALGGAFGAWLELTLLRIRVRILFGRVRLGGPYARAITTGGLVAGLVGILTRFALDGGTFAPRIDALIVLFAIGASYVAVTRVGKVPEAHELLRQVRLERD
jgi:putative peptidoglycan lipid II flippase